MSSIKPRYTDRSLDPEQLEHNRLPAQKFHSMVLVVLVVALCLSKSLIQFDQLFKFSLQKAIKGKAITNLINYT